MNKSSLLSLIFFAVLCGGIAHAGKISFKQVAIGSQDEMVLLDLVEEYELSDTMLEALNNGVPLTFETNFNMRDENSHFWNRDTIDLNLRKVIRYHPLSSQYQVHDLTSDSKQHFATLPAALRALGDIRSQEIISVDELDEDTQYQVSIQTTHDIRALPLPLRPLAYLTPSWYLSSRVYKWRLNP